MGKSLLFSLANDCWSHKSFRGSSTPEESSPVLVSQELSLVFWWHSWGSFGCRSSQSLECVCGQAAIHSLSCEGRDKKLAKSSPGSLLSRQRRWGWMIRPSLATMEFFLYTSGFVIMGWVTVIEWAIGWGGRCFLLCSALQQRPQVLPEECMHLETHSLSRAEGSWRLETLKYHSEGCSCSIYDQSESRMYQKASVGVS